MKYVDGVLEFDRVHSSIGISAMALDYFEDPWSFPSPRFRAWVLATKLRNAESGSNFIDHRLRESQRVILAGSGPEQWLLAGDALRSRHVIIPVLGYRVKRAPSFARILHCHGQFPPLFDKTRGKSAYIHKYKNAFHKCCQPMRGCRLNRSLGSSLFYH